MGSGGVTSGYALSGLDTRWSVAGFADATDDRQVDILWRGPSGEVVL